MAFNSLNFLVFLAAACVVCYVFPQRFRYLWLIFCSVAFYLCGADNRGLPALGLMLFAALVSFFCAAGIHKSESKTTRRVLLIVTLAACLGLLAALKYLDFFALLLQQMMGLPFEQFTRFNLILPLGISYYTLQTVSYAMDVYRGNLAPEKNLLRYFLYVSFFPGIVTGPINRAGAMLPQYKAPARFDYDRVAGGLFRILWGIFKKMVIADNLYAITSTVFGDPQKYLGYHHVVAILVFAYQLYMDFSGSCDVAIGAARMLGFTFMENFRRPFSAKTYQELWRHWHISLTSFFRDYLYIPLGGNRVGKPRWIFNTLLVFTISGLWHGASLGYLIWGFLCGSVLVAARLLQKPKERLAGAIPYYDGTRARGFVQRVTVYLLFAFTFSVFAAALYQTQLLLWLSRLFTGWLSFFTGRLTLSFTGTGLDLATLVAVGVCILAVEIIEKLAIQGEANIADWIRLRAWPLRWGLYYLLIFGLLAFGVFGQSVFIYQMY